MLPHLIALLFLLAIPSARAVDGTLIIAERVAAGGQETFVLRIDGKPGSQAPYEQATLRAVAHRPGFRWGAKAVIGNAAGFLWFFSDSTGGTTIERVVGSQVTALRGSAEVFAAFGTFSPDEALGWSNENQQFALVRDGSIDWVSAAARQGKRLYDVSVARVSVDTVVLFGTENSGAFDGTNVAEYRYEIYRFGTDGLLHLASWHPVDDVVVGKHPLLTEQGVFHASAYARVPSLYHIDHAPAPGVGKLPNGPAFRTHQQAIPLALVHAPGTAVPWLYTLVNGDLDVRALVQTWTTAPSVAQLGSADTLRAAMEKWAPAATSHWVDVQIGSLGRELQPWQTASRSLAAAGAPNASHPATSARRRLEELWAFARGLHGSGNDPSRPAPGVCRGAGFGSAPNAERVAPQRACRCTGRSRAVGARVRTHTLDRARQSVRFPGSRPRCFPRKVRRLRSEARSLVWVSTGPRRVR